jgi:hypothetical protein
MALTNLNEKINNYRDTAAAIRNEHNARVELIRNNTKLSSDGKAAQIARSYRESAQQINDLEAKERVALADQRLELERALFGQFSSDPTSLMNYRDAQERVARLTTDDHAEARQLLHTAQISGDDTLAAALLGRAVNVGWNDIVTRYSEQHPDRAVQLKDLSDVIHFQEDHTVDFQRSADYSFSKPNEVAHLTDNNIERMAATDTDTPAEPEALGMRELQQWAVDHA